MNKYFSITTLLLMMSNLINAQEAVMQFSMEEAEAYALQHNKTLQNVREDLRIAGEALKEARGQGLPQLSGTFDYMTNFNYEFEFSVGGGEPSEPPQISNPELLQPGDLEVLNYIQQLFAPSEGGSTIVMRDQANAILQVSQLIFSGQYWVGMEIARIGKILTEKNISLSELDVKEQVQNTYQTILVSEKLEEIIIENQSNLEEVLEHTNNMYEAGIAEQTDVDQIRINLSQLENSRRAMERNIQLSYNMLRFLMGIDSEIQVHLKDRLEDLTDEITAEQVFNKGDDVKDNPSYQILQVQEAMSEENIKMQKWSFAPTIAGYYSYREKILTTDFDLSPKNAAGLTLSLPIYSGGTKSAALSKARIELDKTRRSRELLKEQLSIQESQLNFELTSAWENYLTQKENVEVAQRLYNSINNKYKQGLVSSLDLTQANSNYLQAENNYMTSILDLLQAKLKLEKLYNNL
ncbi:MAG: TolC family protein [Bacteroidota bacterium]